MRTKLARVLCVVVITLMTMSGHGESGLRRSLADKALAAEPELALMASGSCPIDDAHWASWRDAKIRYLLKLYPPTYERWVDGKWNRVRGDDWYLDLQAVMMRSTRIHEELKKCGNVPDAIVGNLRKFVDAQHNANFNKGLEHQFGLQMTDREYLKLASPALELPCLLKSQDFLQAMARPASYPMALEMIREHNDGKAGHGCASGSAPWMTLLFRSRFISTPDNAHTFGRLLVIEPGEDYDRWIQFGIWTPEDLADGKEAPIIRNVSVAAVARHPEQAGGAQFDAIADFFRCEDTACGETVTAAAPAPCPAASSGFGICSRLAVTNETDNCQRCHKMMPNAIHPEHVYDFGIDKRWRVLDDPSAAAAIKPINARISIAYDRLPIYEVPVRGSEMPADWGMYGGIGIGADPAVYGQDDRSRESVRACVAKAKISLTEASVGKVKDAMNCGECHAANARPPRFGVLNYPLATEKRRSGPIKDPSTEVHVPNMIESHILRGAMPLKTDQGQVTAEPVDLTPDEREALYVCLSDEYFHPPSDPTGSPSGLFVDWLRNQDNKKNPPSTFARKFPPASQLLMENAVLVLADDSQEFEQRCARCHSVVPGEAKRAPNLFGIFGRRMGSDPKAIESGQYSDGLKALAGDPGSTWDEANLMAFLDDPEAFVNAKSGRHDGSTMDRSYPDAAVRQRIVDYLKSVK